MANAIDEEIYLENNDVIHVTPTVDQANPSTGALETVPLTGRTDGAAFLSLSGLTDGTATAVAGTGMSVTLTEIGSLTGHYSNTITGANKTSALSAMADGDTLFKHYKFGSDYHVAVSCILRKTRPISRT